MIKSIARSIRRNSIPFPDTWKRVRKVMTQKRPGQCPGLQSFGILCHLLLGALITFAVKWITVPLGINGTVGSGPAGGLRVSALTG